MKGDFRRKYKVERPFFYPLYNEGAKIDVLGVKILKITKKNLQIERKCLV